MYRNNQTFLQPILEDPEIFRVYVDTKNVISDSTQETILNHHLKWQMMLMPNLGILNNISHVGGTTGLELRYQYLITEILEKSWKEKIRFLKLANVKYIISSQMLDRIPELIGQVERINSIVYRIRNNLPRAWIVGQLHPIRNGTISELIDGSFDPASSALTKGEIVDRNNKAFFREIDDISYKQTGKIHIELTTETPGILVLSESSYPGWKVFVDGMEKECLWLNLLFQGVEIEKGKHEIDFIYRPKYFSLFASISIVSLVLFLFLWFFSILSVRKKRHITILDIDK
ncbi:MAG: YfhO family protein [Deltaproteobacteria bacterium]|nr:YfhO family protein [Deltaproteobacteria bacterium]